jgi:hypothetical protein
MMRTGSAPPYHFAASPRGPVRVAAFRQQHGPGAHLDRGIDDRPRELLLQAQVAVVEADVGRVEPGAVEGPLRADAVEDLRRVSQCLGVFAEFGRCGGHQDLGLRQIARDLDSVLLADLAQDVGQVFARRRRAAPFLGRPVHQRQALRDQPGLEHAVARFLDELGDIDAHRADDRAAPAHRAGVVDQFLPALQLLDRELAAQAERTNDRRERAHFAEIRTAEWFQLVDRGVLRIARADVEMARLRAEPAAHAALDVQRGGDAELAHETLHRGVDPCRVGSLALLVVRRDRRVHSATPRWLKRMPVAPRENTNRNACISLPNGNQIRSAAMLSTWTASRVS